MNKYEKEEIATLPEQYKPMGAWGYWGWSFLFSIPLVGFIILIATALGSTNINRRSYARSFFCGWLIALVLIAVMVVLVIFVFPSLIESYFMPLIEYIMQQR